MPDEFIDIAVLEIGEGVKEVTIVDWLKQPGEQVEAGELLAEVMTDKANMEVESPAAGTLSDIYFGKDAVVEVGTRIGRILVGK